MRNDPATTTKSDAKRSGAAGAGIAVAILAAIAVLIRHPWSNAAPVSNATVPAPQTAVSGSPPAASSSLNGAGTGAGGRTLPGQGGNTNGAYGTGGVNGTGRQTAGNSSTDSGTAGSATTGGSSGSNP
jgi:hypothetical protein